MKEEMMLSNIEKNTNSEFFLEMLKKNWSKFQSIYAIGNLIGEAYMISIINKDGYGFEEYMKQIDNLYNQLYEKNISPEQFEYEKSKTISLIIANKLGIDVNKDITEFDMLKIKEYFLKEYVLDGYVAHSFPEAYYELITSNGLISDPNQKTDKPKDIMEIQDIFMKKGIVSPLGGYPYYNGTGIYYEHDFRKVFQHSIYSPEWFVWFTSSDHQKAFNDDISKSPYVLRNEDGCRKNVMDLCLNAQLNEEDTYKVIEFYKMNYAKYSSSKLNVALISKKTLGKDDIEKTVPRDMDLLSTITYVLNDKANQYSEHIGNVYNGIISPANFMVSVIPSASKYINASEYSRESRENLINAETNLNALMRVMALKDRLDVSMIPKIVQSKQVIERNLGELSKTDTITNENKRENKNVKVRTLTKNNFQKSGFVSFVVLIFIIVFVILILLFIMR